MHKPIDVMLVTKQRIRSIWEELELGLGSGANFRILLYIALNPNESFTKYALVKVTGLRTPDVGKQLETLINLGWLKEDNGTHLAEVSYRLNNKNDVIKLTSELIWNLKHIR